MTPAILAAIAAIVAAPIVYFVICLASPLGGFIVGLGLAPLFTIIGFPHAIIGLLVIWLVGGFFHSIRN
jgi:hypothetical protein